MFLGSSRVWILVGDEVNNKCVFQRVGSSIGCNQNIAPA